MTDIAEFIVGPAKGLTVGAALPTFGFFHLTALPIGTN
jgi:hypothetical protein